jgi:hypothetical protein
MRTAAPQAGTGRPLEAMARKVKELPPDRPPNGAPTGTTADAERSSHQSPDRGNRQVIAAQVQWPAIGDRATGQCEARHRSP